MTQHWAAEPELLTALESAVPAILDTQNPDGRFGDEPWVCRDQDVIFSLAAAWWLPESRHHADGDVLDAVIRGGDALIEDADEDGKWVFRKKDGSTWGMIAMPWTYRRWICAHGLIRDQMPSEARLRWEGALKRGFHTIERECIGRYHNIPAFHASGLYLAGRLLEMPDWEERAEEFLRGLTRQQSEWGWWSEHSGPVVGYNYVYVDALGFYYSVSRDEAVLSALEKAAKFHADYTYPDGTPVETIDERNPYHETIRPGNVGFSHTVAGRGFLRQQHRRLLATGGGFDADYAAHMLLYAASGEAEPLAGALDKYTSSMGTDAAVWRRAPWYCVGSAYTAEVPGNRWIQDRQNLVSVFHDAAGLIIGGGNTKLQPLWSSFTVGDTSLLAHTEGDEDPDFTPPDGLIHTPAEAEVTVEAGGLHLDARYGEVACRITIAHNDAGELTPVWEVAAGEPVGVEAHVPLVVAPGDETELPSGETLTLGDAEVSLRLGAGRIRGDGWFIELDHGASLRWPVVPHNPYRKDGRAAPAEARAVICLPFSESRRRWELRVGAG